MITSLNRVNNKLKPLLKVLSLVLLIGAPTLEAAQYARKAAAALGSAAYWGLSLSQPVTMAYIMKAKSDEEKAYGEHDEVVDAERFSETMPFLKKELKHLGLPEVRIIPYDASVALMQDICIERNLLVSAEESFVRIKQAELCGQEPLAEDLKVIHELQGVLNHEANHILHADAKWRFLAVAAGSALVPVGLRSAYRVVRPAVDQVKKMPNVRKVLSGFINLQASGHIFNSASREFEQQADDAIVGKDRLQGMIYFLEKNDAELREKCKDSPIELWLYRHAATHPSPLSRIEKLKSRLQEK